MWWACLGGSLTRWVPQAPCLLACPGGSRLPPCHSPAGSCRHRRLPSAAAGSACKVFGAHTVERLAPHPTFCPSLPCPAACVQKRALLDDDADFIREVGSRRWGQASWASRQGGVARMEGLWGWKVHPRLLVAGLLAHTPPTTATPFASAGTSTACQIGVVSALSTPGHVHRHTGHPPRAAHCAGAAMRSQVGSGVSAAPGMDPNLELDRLLARYRTWKKEFKVGVGVGGGRSRREQLPWWPRSWVFAPAWILVHAALRFSGPALNSRRCNACRRSGSTARSV